MAKIYIYCLIDPRDGKPFYVGATAWPSHRYAAHKRSTVGIWEAPNCIMNRRARKIIAIAKAKLVLRMDTLRITTPRMAAKWEIYYYKLFIKEGNKLIQMPKFHPRVYSSKYFNNHSLQ